MKYEEKTTCRVCDGTLTTVLNLGKIYPSTFVDDNFPNDIEPVPLDLTRCDKCRIVQLRHTLDRDTMYRKYWYRSRLNKSMVQSLQDIVTSIEDLGIIQEGDLVVDIGCNDGTLLSLYKERVVKVGFDPAKNLAEEASRYCHYFINDYFSAKNYRDVAKAKVVTSIAMFYDLDDPVPFIQDVKSILDKKGVWVIQMTDFMSMLRINAFDNICHEHLIYYTLSNMINLLADNDLDVFKVSYNEVNGGSVRIFVCHDGIYPPDKSVYLSILMEKDFFERDNIDKFADRVKEIKEQVMKFLDTSYLNGETIAIMGASTKGNTLLQYFGITDELVSHAAEINSDKFGKRTVGTNIPIIPQKESLEQHPSLYLVLPWHFILNFVENNKKYLEDGGTFLIPMPEPTWIVKDSETGEVKWISVKNLSPFL